jgi:hypothetical protein
MHDSEKLELRRAITRALKEAKVVTAPTFEQWTRQMLIRLDQMEISLQRMTLQLEEMKQRLEAAEQGRANSSAPPGADPEGGLRTDAGR